VGRGRSSPGRGAKAPADRQRPKNSERSPTADDEQRDACGFALKREAKFPVAFGSCVREERQVPDWVFRARLAFVSGCDWRPHTKQRKGRLGMEANVRTWGPFNGRHLTIMFIGVLAAVVLIPVGAYAVSFTNVAITDPGGVNRAKVSTAGALSVSGGVTANNASATNLYENFGYPSFSAWSSVAAPPAGKALVITSLNFDAYANPTPGGDDLLFEVSAVDASCTSFGYTVGDVNPPSVGVTSIAIPSGLVIPAGRALCAHQNGNLGTETMIYGYLVPAASAPPGLSSARKPALLPSQLHK
jgi:hypothetical protein